MTNWDQARTTAQEIGQRAKSDAGFMQQLQSDPIATLKGVGMPDEVIGAFLSEEGLSDDEVQGYGMNFKVRRFNTIEGFSRAGDIETHNESGMPCLCTGDCCASIRKPY